MNASNRKSPQGRYKLPWKAIGDSFDPLLIAIPNLLEREKPAELWRVPGAPVVVIGLTHLAIDTHRAIRYISAPTPPDPDRRPELAVVVPALSRTILEGLFSLVFLLDSLEARTRQYYRGGWRELQDGHTRLKTAYGHLDDWMDWLARQKEMLDQLVSDAPITPAELSKPSSVDRWPTPGSMLRDPKLGKPAKEFLAYLYDWFYRDLSQAAHLTFPALSLLAAPFMVSPADTPEGALETLRSDWFVTSLILLLCHLSELEICFHLGRAEKLAYCWGMLVPDNVAVREVFDRRYRGRLIP